MSLNILSQVLILISVLSTVTHGEKILFLVGLASHSHRVAIQPLATKLADLGHDVTFFAPIKPEVSNPKIKEFCTQHLKEINAQMSDEVSMRGVLGRLKDRNYDPFFQEGGKYFMDVMYTGAEATVNSEFVDWIKDSRFDLIIFDHGGKEYLYPVAHHMKAKIIEFIPNVHPYMASIDSTGFPLEPWIHTFASNKFSFIPDRFFNAYIVLKWYYEYRSDYLPKIEALARRMFSFDFPPLEELIRRTDLIFVNDHPSMGHAPAYPPYIVPVAGLHVKDSNGTLPKDIADFLADTERFIFISFGSIIQVSKLPPQMQQVLFDSVAEAKKTKFLWKWEGDMPAKLPKNVMAKKWFPQQDVLANPKCKGFVTQGGLMSLQQSIHHGVPVVVVPVFGDQPMNARIAKDGGYGMHLELSEITKETFSNALDQLLNNPSYAEKIKQASRQFKDRPMKAVDTAAWWVEYVLRHDTSHLKSEAVKLNWFQRRLLDLWLAVFSLLIILTGALSYVVYFVFTRFCRKNSAQKLKAS